MTLEKLQKIATSVVHGTYKMRWLRWWNSSPMLRAANHFPPSPAKEKFLDSFIARASLWAHVFHNNLVSYHM